MRSAFPVLAAIALLTGGAPGRAARAAPSDLTGRYIIKLKEVPPPPRLLKIEEHLEGQYRRGGRRVPYVLVQPNRPSEFKLPAKLKSLVAYVEPERWYSHMDAAGTRREFVPTLLTMRPVPQRDIGASSSGEGEEVPEGPAAIVASTPNDPYYSYQWGLQDSGFGIRLPTARGYTKGAGVTVGIVDSGVRQDLADLRGTRFLAPFNAMVSKAGGTDDNGHGSHVCGTIAQATDNRVGTAGVAPLASVLSVKALGADGRGTNFTIASGIRYAVDQGCSVINCSIGGAPSRTLADAVAYATSKQVLLVCSSGNGGNAALTYPAAYSDTLSVGAIESNGVRAAWSQYGAGLGVVAPGGDILQQTFNPQTGAPGYYRYSGTSMAAPHVTGIAALVKSLRPSLTRAELKLLLMNTATDLGPRGTDAQYGFGLVNAAAACARAVGGGVSPAEPPVPPGDPIPPTAPGVDAIVAETLGIVNEERQKAGAQPLSLHPQLIAAAAAHAADMRSHGVMSHTGSDGSNPGTRIARAGYPAITWAENIAAGYPTAIAVMDAWLRSPGHRTNILNPALKEIGIAKDGAYWVECFGARRQ